MEETAEALDLAKYNAIGGSTYYHDSYVPLIVVEEFGTEGAYNIYFTGDDVEGYDAHDSLIRWVLERPETFRIRNVAEIITIRDTYGEYLEVEYKDDDGEVDTDTIFYKIVGVHTLVHRHGENKYIRIEAEEYMKAKFPSLYKA